MSTNLVIAAIPDENDRVWKVSSEKIPHLTVLFLGDVDKVANLDSIMQFVEHAADRSLKRFYLPVDRRGELGEDKADVLFFKKGRYDFKAIRDFRAVLLQDHNIKTAYDSAEQFDGPWTPHLTLGYPSAPAKKVSDDQIASFFDVSFNKIAVWVGDFEGPEFLLKDYWDDWEDMDIPMDIPLSMTNLSHVSEKPWSDYTKADYSNEQWHAACLIHTHEGEATSKSECKLPVKTPNGALNRNGVHAAAAALAGARGGLKGVSDDQKKKAASALKRYYGQLDEEAPESLAEHSVELDKAKRNERGQVVRVDFGTNPTEDTMAQTVEEFLDHHGVKGMKWGVRKDTVGGAAKSVGRAAKSTGGAVGKAAVATGRFVGDVNFESRVETGKAREAVINATAKPFARQDLPAVKARHGDYGKLRNRAKKPLSKEARAYRADARETYIKRLETTANSMTNVSGNRQYTVRERGIDLPSQGGNLPVSKYYWDVSARDVAHAFADAFTRLELVMEDGYITDLKKVKIDDSMAQTTDLGAAFLAHYGVKGMRWGQRRSLPTAVTPAARSVVPRGAKRKTKIEVKGGENHDASDDAIRVARAHAKLKKSGPAALSNKELQDVQTRLNLERNVNQLVGAKTTVGKGRQFVKGLTGFGKEFNESINTGVNTTRLVKQLT